MRSFAKPQLDSTLAPTQAPQVANDSRTVGVHSHSLGNLTIHPTSGGQSLDPTIRSFAENRFGHDFSGVRIHSDERAAESARAANALAYTTGNDIVFASGRYTPKTPGGMNLLAHELTHVVQQKQSCARAGALGDLQERHAGAVAETFTKGGDISNLLRKSPTGVCPTLQRQDPATQPTVAQPTAAPPPPPLDYDRTPFTTTLGTGHTVASMETALNDKISKGAITSFAVNKVTKGSNAEIFLLNLIWAWGKKDRWGTEADMVTAIDWPAKPTDPAPQGRVTLRISTTGAATAELIGTGGVPAVAQTTVAAGSTKLKADFGFASVKDDGTATWSPAEISDVAAALVLLPVADKPALKGVELIRVKVLPDNRSGEYSSGGGVAQGATSATKASLKLADSAFPTTQVQFYGGTKGTVPASFQTILHEVGHAVEEEIYRAAREPHAKAIIDQNAAVVPLNKTVADLKPMSDERSELFAKYQAATGADKEALRKKIEALDLKMKPLRTKYTAERAKYDTAEAAVTTKKAEVEKTRVAAAAIQPLEADAATKKTSAATALTTAQSGIKGLQADEISTSAAYAKAVEDTAAAIAAFVTEALAGKTDIDGLEATVLAVAAARDAARDALAQATPGHNASAILGRAASAQDKWLEAERVFARARKRTLRVQKFIDLVTTNNIQRFTQYSKDNWLFKPEEFYAEAYSLWRVDPEFLETNYKVVYDFFESGDYRK